MKLVGFKEVSIQLCQNQVLLSDSPALPICTASLVSLPWRTDFSFFGRLAFFFSSASAPSSLFRGCISIAAPSCALAAAKNKNKLLKKTKLYSSRAKKFKIVLRGAFKCNVNYSILIQSITVFSVFIFKQTKSA